MVRNRRRQPVDEPAPISPRMALEYERTGTWPAGERIRWWSRIEVPSWLRETRRPDPRVVLGADELTRLNHQNDLNEWRARRLAYLEEQANNG